MTRGSWNESRHFSALSGNDPQGKGKVRPICGHVFTYFFIEVDINKI